MTIKAAINGYGRIGRNILRGAYEENYTDQVEIIAINSLGTPASNAHLTKFDTTHGPFRGDVHVEGEDLLVNGHRVHVSSERDPNKLPWREMDIDIVFECTGAFTSKDKAAVHLADGARQVLISAPATDADLMVVYGVNHQMLKAEHRIVSNASCTTNCLAPIAKVLNDTIGIEKGTMTTIHSYTNDQALIDVYHKDLRRARSATQSMIHTKTGAASAIGAVIPELDGKLDGCAVRVPTTNVSLVDLCFIASRDTSAEEIDTVMREASLGAFSGIIDINELPLVSADFNHHPASAIYDATQTKVNGNLAKVFAWYDNEWAFSLRMLDTALAMASSIGKIK